MEGQVRAIWNAFQQRARRRWWIWLPLTVVGLLVGDRLQGWANAVLDDVGLPQFLGDLIGPLYLPLFLVAAAVIVLLVLAYRDSSGELPPPGEDSAPPTTDAVLGQWQTDRAARGVAELRAEQHERAYNEGKRATNDYRNALNKALTWLYRRANTGLSPDAVGREPAPEHWAPQMYNHVGLPANVYPYQPPQVVEVEPSYSSPQAPSDVRTPKGVTADVVRGRPAFYNELTDDQRNEYRQRLCAKRTALLANAQEVDDLIVHPETSPVTSSKAVAALRKEIEAYVTKHWQLDIRQWRVEVNDLKVEPSALPSTKAAHRTEAQKLMLWLRLNGLTLCGQSPDGSPQPAPRMNKDATA